MELAVRESSRYAVAAPRTRARFEDTANGDARLPAMPKDDEDTIEVRCPECSEVIRLSRETAERDYKAKCSKGHEVPLAKAF